MIDPFPRVLMHGSLGPAEEAGKITYLCSQIHRKSSRNGPGTRKAGSGR